MKYVVEITATFMFFNIFPKQKTNFCIKDEQNFLKNFGITSSVTLTFPPKKIKVLMTLSASCDLCRASCFPKPRNKETSKPNHEISPAGGNICEFVGAH